MSTSLATSLFTSAKLQHCHTWKRQPLFLCTWIFSDDTSTLPWFLTLAMPLIFFIKIRDTSLIALLLSVLCDCRLFLCFWKPVKKLKFGIQGSLRFSLWNTSCCLIHCCTHRLQSSFISSGGTCPPHCSIKIIITNRLFIHRFRSCFCLWWVAKRAASVISLQDLALYDVNEIKHWTWKL